MTLDALSLEELRLAHDELVARMRSVWENPDEADCPDWLAETFTSLLRKVVSEIQARSLGRSALMS
jgi:hypothetical protein